MKLVSARVRTKLVYSVPHKVSCGTVAVAPHHCQAIDYEEKDLHIHVQPVLIAGLGVRRHPLLCSWTPSARQHWRRRAVGHAELTKTGNSKQTSSQEAPP